MNPDAEKLRELASVMVARVEATLWFDPHEWVPILGEIADRLDLHGRPIVDVPLPDPAENSEGLVGRDHPYTSRKAAWHAMPRSGTQRYRVLMRLALRPSTDEELQHALGMDGNTERPRRVELVGGGWVEPSGEERGTRACESATVWRLTPKAKAALS